ncbi:MAG: efflux RND transporter permease subunit [Gammaproteobacteria bacterium]|nr:efflux RND transporter permease subunit [Gammaproteobacteria bacterium]
MSITAISLRRPITIVMVFVSLAAFGLISSRLLPLEQLPDIQFPGSFINVPYQGSSPEEVERLITRPIEEALATMSGIQFMRSTSTQNSAQIGMFFGWDTDAAVKGMEVMDKIDSVRGNLPDDVDRIFVFRGSTSDQPILNLRLSSESVALENAYDLLDRNLKRRLERLEGVSQVRLEGVEPWEIRIELLPARIAAHGVSIAEVNQRLQQANFSITAGEITDQGRRLRVHPMGQFESIEDIKNLLLRPNLRIGDVANVVYESRERTYGRHLDQRYAIGIAVLKETGANMVAVADRVMAEIEKINKLPQMRGIKIFFLDNQAESVKTSLTDLTMAGVIGALLSLVVLYFFLRQVSTTLMVTLAVPFSLSITLAAMYFLGISLNILSMMGLMLAIGMLVDNAVVVTENIFRKKQEDNGLDDEESTIVGTKEVSTAVTAGTLTTIIVFLPIIFGEKIDITVFLEHVAVTIIVSLVASLFISLTIIPMIASRIDVPPPREGGLIPRLKRAYERFLPWSLHRRVLVFILTLFVLVGGFVTFGAFVKQDMFPQDTNRRLFMPYHLDGTYSLETVEAAVDRIEEYLYANADEFEIDSVYTYFEEGRAQSSILLKGEDEGATKSVSEIQDMIREGLPELAIGKPSFDFNQSGNQDGISIRLSGESSEVLFELSDEVARLLESVEGMADVRSETTGGDREIQVIVDRDRALRYGMSTQEIAQSIAVAMRGQNLREFRGESGEIEIRVEFANSDEQTISDLEQLPLFTANGDRITLSAVADLAITRGPAQITRFNRVTSITLQGGLEDGATMDEVRPRIQKMMDNAALPAGYTWSFGQGFDRAERTRNVMGENMILAVLLILIVMAALFEALLQPLGILLSIVFSFAGVFYFFALTGTTFSFMAMIGLLILMGIVVNNGIVMVDHINNLRREGKTRFDAVVQGCSDRLRPILMTVATTVVGMTPLALSDTSVGGGGPPYFPMARAIIGGLVFSTLITLIVLPSVYVMLDDLGRWGRRVKQRAKAGRAARASL